MKTRLLVLIGIAIFSVLPYGLISADAHHDETISRGSDEPIITTFGDDLYVVWKESSDPQFWDVYFRKITGNTLEEPINLTHGTSFYPRPQVLASENNVYVLWEDRQSPEGDDAVYFTKSNDSGKTFDKIKKLDPTSGDQSIYRPRVMLESNDILYVFVSHWNKDTQQNNLIFLTSQDHGKTFSKPTVLFESGQWEDYVDFKVNDGIIYILADDQKNYDEIGGLNLRKIFPDGSLSDIISVNGGSTAVTTAQMAISENNVYVAWRAWENNRWHLAFAKSSDGGDTFEKPITLNSDPKSVDTVWSEGTHVFAHGDSVYVVWPEEYWDGTNQSFHTWIATSHNLGADFDAKIIPLDDLLYKYGQILTIQQDSNLYFIAMTTKNPPFNDAAIYFTTKNSDDTYAKPVDIFKDISVAGGQPQVMSEGNNIHLVTDKRSDENCILYSFSNDGGKSFSKVVNLSPNGDDFQCIGVLPDISAPIKQIKSGTDIQNVQCQEDRTKGYILALRERDELPVCVTAKSYLSLLERNWILPDSLEKLALKAAEKFVISSTTFSVGGIKDSLKLDIANLRKTIPPVITINGEFESRHSGYGDQGDAPNGKFTHPITIEVAQTNKIHSAVIDGIWDEIAQKPVSWVSKENLKGFHSGPTSTMILTVGDKIVPSGMVPVTVTEISENVLDEITFWQFQPIGYNGDNRGMTWDFLPRDLETGWGFFDENGQNPWDNSKIPQDMYGIPADLHGYPVYCGTEKIDGESGHPSYIPIKLGASTVYAKSGSRGILPDPNGIYTIKFVSLFKTTAELPGNVKIITNNTKLCPLEDIIEDATHAYYTKLVFKMSD